MVVLMRSLKGDLLAVFSELVWLFSASITGRLQHKARTSLLDLVERGQYSNLACFYSAGRGRSLLDLAEADKVGSWLMFVVQGADGACWACELRGNARSLPERARLVLMIFAVLRRTCYQLLEN